ncbi:MAG: hypothetical protein A2V67_13690 [Deltaproteobacteria bacterium RBG_13_61_14]|nr:MAG: hypothetical protein A2V67_13690 [Deltaproteobacteria bacterium RBG_13_61_14]
MANLEEILVSEQVLQVPYSYSAGPVASRFLLALKEEKKIYGIWCAACNKVYVPPRATCGQCQAEIKDWVPLSGQGRVESFAVVHYAESIQPLPPPYVIAVIKLDGADTGFTHLLGEVDEKKLKIGLKVEPVFARERKGHILDIRYFKPI